MPTPIAESTAPTTSTGKTVVKVPKIDSDSPDPQSESSTVVKITSGLLIAETVGALIGFAGIVCSAHILHLSSEVNIWKTNLLF